MHTISAVNQRTCPGNQTRHPCAGCDALLTLPECAGYVFGGAPLCAGCYRRGQASPEFAALVQRAVSMGHTLPAVRHAFARDGLELPVTREENQRATAVLRGLDAMEAAQHPGQVQ